jgi:hypothetical protein
MVLVTHAGSDVPPARRDETGRQPAKNFCTASAIEALMAALEMMMSTAVSDVCV